MINTHAYALELDDRDPLRSFRQKFLIPKSGNRELIYFLGNSLGLQPEGTNHAIQNVLRQWSSLGVESFFKGESPWLDYHNKLAESLQPIAGALPSELVVMNQLSVNLHLLLVSFYTALGKRKKIICEAKAFPSDQYVLETFIKHLNLDPEEIIIEIRPREKEAFLREEDILEAIYKTGDELALVVFGGLNYYTGQLFDIRAITEAAQTVGAKAGFDLAHAAGNVELKLHEWNVDFACWCNYKYLNAGPGAIATAFIHERYINDPEIKRLAGWWGYKKESRFLMQKGFTPDRGATGWQLSTPSILLYACLDASLEIFTAAGMERILSKSRLMQDYLFYILHEIRAEASGHSFEILTPEDPAKRGSQVSLRMFENGKEVFDKLTEAGIFADWREPDVIRIAPVPLYNRFEEIWIFGDVFRKALKQL